MQKVRTTFPLPPFPPSKFPFPLFFLAPPPPPPGLIPARPVPSPDILPLPPLPPPVGALAPVWLYVLTPLDPVPADDPPPPP
ncbi:MAG: hypothetical protein CVT94_11890 [Bacteroidetes bacterium HGW-Bacteroidetes-11]|nr:MAG: hypothetical protein CVT94_11890 [Bacteroidetes bacterium HGW-Bacteroidetes-11]